MVAAAAAGPEDFIKDPKIWASLVQIYWISSKMMVVIFWLLCGPIRANEKEEEEEEDAKKKKKKCCNLWQFSVARETASGCASSGMKFLAQMQLGRTGNLP